MKDESGLGLTEVIISLLLSTIIMSALINHYLGTKKQYQLIESTLEQSYELQMVADLIRDSIRSAGFTPCLGIDHLLSIDKRNGQRNLQSIDFNKGASLNINRMSEYFDSVISIVNHKELLTTTTQKINLLHPIIIADCYHAEVQKVEQVMRSDSNQIVKLDDPLYFNYQPPIYVGEWIEESFFIAPHEQSKAALYYKQHHTDELSEKIQGMTVSSLNQNPHRLIRILLQLKNQGTLLLETTVRAT